jgi:hypothetical protein
VTTKTKATKKAKAKKPAAKAAGKRASAKAVKPSATAKARDPRLPAVGATITRTYKGKEFKVEVTEGGFRHAGKDWRSLTALARAITGYKAVSGPRFFGTDEASSAKGGA